MYTRSAIAGLYGPFPGYRVVTSTMVPRGYVINHIDRVIIFAASTARAMCRRERRRRARASGRRLSVRVPPLSLADALDALLQR